jgi:hypothetical protein
MPRFAQRVLTPEFRDAVRSDERGIVQLAQLIGITSYPTLSRLLSKRRVTATPLVRTRLQQLATLINYTGEVFRG